MQENDLLKGYDDLLESKKSSTLYIRLISLMAIVAVIGSLIWSFSVYISSIDKIKVVNQYGSALNSSLQSEDKLIKTLIKNQCATAVYYLNSFDRLTIKENQAKAFFLVSRPDAERIFAMYNEKRNYGDALDRGVIYQAELKDVVSLSTDKEPYQVTYTSVLSVMDNNQPVQKFLITSQGELIRHTPQYPENPFGLYFKSYSQSYEKISADE